MLMCGFNLNEGAMCAEMQKVADAADLSVLFSAGANFWAVLGHFWAILAIWVIMHLCYLNRFLQLWSQVSVEIVFKKSSSKDKEKLEGDWMSLFTGSRTRDGDGALRYYASFYLAMMIVEVAMMMA